MCNGCYIAVSGQIRTTIGQAELLIAQRFKQFSGLVDDCEFKTSEKEVTCTDLQGFWDMIYYQVCSYMVSVTKVPCFDFMEGPLTLVLLLLMNNFYCNN